MGEAFGEVGRRTGIIIRSLASLRTGRLKQLPLCSTTGLIRISHEARPFSTGSICSRQDVIRDGEAVILHFVAAALSRALLVLVCVSQLILIDLPTSTCCVSLYDTPDPTSRTS